MTPEIERLVNQGKTCSPVKCGSEQVCFRLATEVERLSKELHLAEIKLAALRIRPSQEPFSIPEPSFDAPLPLWQE